MKRTAHHFVSGLWIVAIVCGAITTADLTAQGYHDCTAVHPSSAPSICGSRQPCAAPAGCNSFPSSYCNDTCVGKKSGKGTCDCSYYDMISDFGYCQTSGVLTCQICTKYFCSRIVYYNWVDNQGQCQEEQCQVFAFQPEVCIPG
jgi:hypothetical protein